MIWILSIGADKISIKGKLTDNKKFYRLVFSKIAIEVTESESVSVSSTNYWLGR